MQINYALITRAAGQLLLRDIPISGKSWWLALIFICLLITGVSAQQVSHGRGLPMKSLSAEMNEVMEFYTGEVDPDSILGFIQGMQDLETRFALAPNRRDVATWIHDKFVSFGYADARLDSFQLNFTYRAQSYQTWQYNVIAEYRGYQWPDSIHILGGHYDSIVTDEEDDPFEYAPGADDNASGVAAILEIARLFKEHGYEPANTIHFIAFGAEELGLHGSWHHANQALAQDEGIVMMVNNDMIGHTLHQEGFWGLEIQYYPGSDWLTTLAREVAQEYTSLNIVEGNSVIRFTDSWPFHSVGYDAVFLHEEHFSPFYHSPKDVVENINEDYAAEMVKVSMGIMVSQNGPGNAEVVSADGGLSGRDGHNRLFASDRQLHLRFGEARPGRRLRVYDTSGRLLMDRQLEAATHHELYMPFGPGIYLVQVAGETETIAGKIMLP
jgi:hypothetical protein